MRFKKSRHFRRPQTSYAVSASLTNLLTIESKERPLPLTVGINFLFTERNTPHQKK
jgi:hypothetical protein